MMTATKLAILIIKHENEKFVEMGRSVLWTALDGMTAVYQDAIGEFIYICHCKWLFHKHGMEGVVVRLDFPYHDFIIEQYTSKATSKPYWRWVGKKPSDVTLGLLRLSL